MQFLSTCLALKYLLSKLSLFGSLPQKAEVDLANILVLTRPTGNSHHCKELKVLLVLHTLE